MNPEVKKLWVDALRSGEYKQCTGILAKEDGSRCVLGVLLAVAAKNNVPCNFSQTEDGYLIPQSVADWAGLDFKDVCYPGTFADMNDRAYLSFPKLADWIEANR
jgi:hypothetical protein